MVVASHRAAHGGSGICRSRTDRAKEYKAACKAWNEAAVKVGLPAFRYYESSWGTIGEVFLEAEFEDSGDIERRFAAAEAAKDPEFEAAGFEAAGLAVAYHITDGQSVSYVLSDLDLG
jgi:hypothetical protein